MKPTVTIWATIAVSALCLVGCIERAGVPAGVGDGPIYHHQFVGTVALIQGTNLAPLKAILARNESADLRRYVVDKFARAPREYWKKQFPAVAPGSEQLLLPVWNDLLSYESLVEIRGAVSKASLLVAAQLGDAQSGVWHTNLSRLVAAWGLGQAKAATLEGASGWEAHGAAGTVQFFRAGHWVVLGIAADKPEGVTELLQRIHQTGRPAPELSDALFAATIDFPRLTGLFPGLSGYHLPPTQFTMRPRGENIRSELKLSYSQALPVKLEAWKIPLEAIKEPLNSFTAARGVAPLLAATDVGRRLGLAQFPNQFCLWGQTHLFAQSFFSAPISGVTNVMHSIAQPLPGLINEIVSSNAGSLFYVSNRAAFRYKTVPYADPQLAPHVEAGQEFVLGSLFSLMPRTNPAPKSLFAQLDSKPNIVYYDWELTHERVLHARQLYSLLDVLNVRQASPTNSPPQRWLSGVTTNFGNTITVATLSSPREITVERKSRVGFTGFELAMLGRWAGSKGFPLSFDPPPPPPLLTNRPSLKHN